MRKILFLIVILFISFLAVAQPPIFSWAKSLGGPQDETGNAVVVDHSGNVYSTGHFSGIVDFDPGAGTFTLDGGSNMDVFVSKLSANGNFVWAVKIGGPGDEEAHAIALDKQGNVLLTGSFMHGADFDPG